MYENGAFCGASTTGSVFGGGGPGAPAVNATITPAWSNDFFLANISATLSGGGVALPTTTDDCKIDGWKAFGQFKNRGDCVSFVTTSGKNSGAR